MKEIHLVFAAIIYTMAIIIVWVKTIVIIIMGWFINIKIIDRKIEIIAKIFMSGSSLIKIWVLEI